MKKKKITQYFHDNELTTKISEKKNIEELWGTVTNHLMKADVDYSKYSFLTDYEKVLPNYHDIEITKLIQNLNLIRTLSKAGEIYRPSNKIRSLTVLFRAKASENLNVKGWKRCLENDAIIKDVDGNHYTMLNTENLEGIVNEIDKIL